MTDRAILFAGQGSQYRGMGEDLFGSFPELTHTASEILGYSIEDLCLRNTDNRLNLTQYCQPALYVVGALRHQKWLSDNPRSNAQFALGHSLGEYNALLAADAFDFSTGLRLVKKRGELMGAASGGTMAAVIGESGNTIRSVLDEYHLDRIDIANFNTPTQVVIAGPADALAEAATRFTARGLRFVQLNVSAPFHSRYMHSAQSEFAKFIRQFELRSPRIPVIANVTGSPYEEGDLADMLVRQIGSSVQWVDSIRYLISQNISDYVELGTTLLTKMVNEIRQQEATRGGERTLAMRETVAKSVAALRLPTDPLAEPTCSPEAKADNNNFPQESHETNGVLYPRGAFCSDGLGAKLGSATFKARYETRYAYAAGSMYRGISSPELVIRLRRAGLMGFLGAGGMSVSELDQKILLIKSGLREGEAFGVNLLANYAAPEEETAVANLLLKHGIRHVEAAAFTQVRPSVVLFRIKGLARDPKGTIISNHHVLAKVSHPDVASAFMSPPPPAMIVNFLSEGKITREQAELASMVPVAGDICVECDSGGHTDGAIPTVALPVILRLREEIAAKYGYKQPICVGQAGGIGTPEAAAVAFLMGADFVVTGSINQCTVEAGTSAAVKTLLQTMGIHDTDKVPAGDMFEMGAKVQVLKSGLFFPARAKKLFSLYQQYGALEEIPEKMLRTLEQSYFRRSLQEVWSGITAHLRERGLIDVAAKAERDGKMKMALTFKWYFYYTTQLALLGDSAEKVNFQVHTGPALGAFNQWVKGTPLEPWTARHVDDIARTLIEAAARYIDEQCRRMTTAGIA